MKKIRSEFLTEKEANSAMDEINKYCSNIKITQGTAGDYGDGYDGYMDYGYLRGGDFAGFPEMGYFGLGGFGMISNWTPGLYGVYGVTDRHARAFPYSSRSSLGGRSALEADVADDNYEYVKEKLYAYGAVSVV
ncbi:MAG: hypothetical protein FWH10_01490 [Oscillospiraceae bacterium]|nr:hypothetical protein [Oscillospiraceae bacterium]